MDFLTLRDLAFSIAVVLGLWLVSAGWLAFVVEQLGAGWRWLLACTGLPLIAALLFVFSLRIAPVGLEWAELQWRMENPAGASPLSAALLLGGRWLFLIGGLAASLSLAVIRLRERPRAILAASALFISGLALFSSSWSAWQA
jgi:hypothetical protein